MRVIQSDILMQRAPFCMNSCISNPSWIRRIYSVCPCVNMYLLIRFSPWSLPDEKLNNGETVSCPFRTSARQISIMILICDIYLRTGLWLYRSQASGYPEPHLSHSKSRQLFILRSGSVRTTRQGPVLHLNFPGCNSWFAVMEFTINLLLWKVYVVGWG